jgi:hypothetical protein
VGCAESVNSSNCIPFEGSANGWILMTNAGSWRPRQHGNAVKEVLPCRSVTCSSLPVRYGMAWNSSNTTNISLRSPKPAKHNPCRQVAGVTLPFNHQQQILGFDFLTGFHQQLADATRQGRVDGALHLHRFQHQQLLSSFDFLA